ncbi:MAG: translational machinery protein [Bradymonadia bacterium]
MNSKQVVVWIDHKEARIFPIEPGESAAVTINAPSHFIHHKHPLGPEGAKAHPEDAKRFFHEVTRTLEGVEAVLIVGPSTAKLELIKYVHQHDHLLEPRIVGVETVDHPTDGQLVAYAKKYFTQSDAPRPSTPR